MVRESFLEEVSLGGVSDQGKSVALQPEVRPTLGLQARSSKPWACVRPSPQAESKVGQARPLILPVFMPL